MQILLIGVTVHIVGLFPIFALFLPGWDKPLVSYDHD